MHSFAQTDGMRGGITGGWLRAGRWYMAHVRHRRQAAAAVSTVRPMSGESMT